MAKSTNSNRETVTTRKSAQRKTQVSPKAKAIGPLERGITTVPEYNRMTSALMADLICERVPTKIASGICALGRGMLTATAMQLKAYGVPMRKAGEPRVLQLVPKAGR